MKIAKDLIHNGRYTSKCIICDCYIQRLLREINNYCIPCQEELKQ